MVSCEVLGSSNEKFEAKVNSHYSGNMRNGHDIRNGNSNQINEDPTEPIAIIGLAFELPGGLTTEDELWDTLINARAHSSEIPKDRWNVDGFYRQGGFKRGVHNVRSAHFLERDIAAFDPSFFGITVNEAHAMDPQQRILLETSYRALENAGLSLEAVSGSDAGVFVGTFSSDYSTLTSRDPDTGAVYRATGTGTAIMSSRLSWFFNLKGPSVAIDTGCSASLVALHLACQSLLNGECNLGLVGGCNLILDPDTMMIMSDSGFLSRDGKCHTFDARANGYGRGEGSGVVLVKRLSDALRDGDTIRAVIRSTDTNQDGFTPGITQPSFSSQTALIQRAYRKAGLTMSDTHFFEAHGTGTPIGDPIEVRAIEDAFEGSLSADRPLLVTALKPNIGHLENVSGVASLIKTILSLEKGIIPPIAGLETPNPAIRHHAGLTFAKEATIWPVGNTRRASINSFGYGGTNVHVVLDDATHYFRQNGLVGHLTTQVNGQDGSSTPDSDCPPETGAFDDIKLLVFSAADKGAVGRTVSDLALHAGQDNSTTFTRDLSFTLSEKRSRLAWRSFAISQPNKPLQESILKDFASPTQARHALHIGFIFTGQGAQWATMGKELATFDVFRNSILQSGHYFQSLGSGWWLLEELSRPDQESRLHEAKISQPVNTALQIALVELLRSWNIVPEAAIGHSSGEIAAAYCAGTMTKHAALKAAYYRGLVADLASQLMQSPAGMLAVAMSKTAAEAKIRSVFGDHHVETTVACINSPKNVTISGYMQHLTLLSSILDKEGIFSRVVKTGVPYHSRLMDPVASIYRNLIHEVESASEPNGIEHASNQQAKTLFFSSTNPRQTPSQTQKASPDYWVQNLVNPVEFSDGMSHMLEYSKKSKVRKLGASAAKPKGAEITHLVEIGPHAALKGPIRDILTNLRLDKTIAYSPTLWRGENAVTALLRLAGQLFVRGCPVNVLAANNYVNLSDVKMLTNLPGYSFNHSSRYWLESRRSKQYRNRKQGYHELLGTPAEDSCPEEARWRQYINSDEHQWVSDHKVLGLVVYPAAGLLVMALEAARQLADNHKTVSGFCFEHVIIGRALVIPSEAPGVEVLITLRKNSHRHHENSEYYEFNIRGFANESWFECCRGNVMIEYKAASDPVSLTTNKLDALRQTHARIAGQLDKTADSKDVYSQFAELGFVYGPAFQALDSIRYGDSMQASAKLNLLKWKKHVSESNLEPHIIHPAALDNILQLSMTALTRGGQESGDSMVPTGIPRLHITPTMSTDLPQSHINVCVEASRTGFRGALAQFCAVGTDGDLCAIQGTLELTAVADARPEVDDTLGFCFAVDWKPDIETLSGIQLTSYCQSTLDKSTLQAYHSQEVASINVRQQAVKHYSKYLKQKNGFHHANLSYLQNYRAFLGRSFEQLSTDFDTCTDWQQYLTNSIANMSADSSAELQLTLRIAENLDSILQGEMDPLQLFFSDDLLVRYYSEILGKPSLAGGLASLVDLLGHKNSSLNILEIGAGTGSASVQMVQTLARNGDSSGEGPRFSSYCYTDISPGFFESARLRLIDHDDRIEYKVLDIEKEPSAQGFNAESFDVILAANVLHATSDLAKTLSHVHWLLKPGGKLILYEPTQPDSLRTGFLFGLLPGWWASKEPQRKLSPLLTDEQWHTTLKQADFTGLEMAIPDETDENHYAVSLLMSSKPEPIVSRTLSKSPIVIVASRQSSMQQSLADDLAALLPRSGATDVVKINLEDEVWNVPRHSTCVFLPELEHDCLRTMSDALLGHIKTTLATVSSMIWLADSDCSTADDSKAMSGLAVGLSRVYKSEHPEVNLINLALQVSRGHESVLQRLCQVLYSLPSEPNQVFEDEYKEVDGVMHINRLVPEMALDQKVRPQLVDQQALQETFRTTVTRHTMMTVTSPGSLESFQFVDNPRFSVPLEDNEVEVEIRATGLNFRDLLVALGQVDDGFFGFECSGVVVAKGSAVDHVSVGDRVACLMQNTFATTGRCNAAAAVRLPENLSFRDAAGILLTAATARYALMHIARLSRGETVLIHSGAGGLGQAAIQVAQAHDAVVYTTVGTAEKKAFLMEQYGIPEEHIFSSRNLEFASALKRLTNGRGVDIVLNSLSGEALRASWRCIAPFGRFLETGKKDILSLGNLPMDVFSNNVTFSGIDLAHIIKDSPTLTGMLLQGVMDMASKKEISIPSPVHGFPGSQIESAFRLMQSGESIGKIVIEFEDSDIVATAPPKLPAWSFDPEACYVVAGGLGGLGRSIAKWMADRGARNLILLSRRTKHSPEAQETIQSLARQGVTVATPACDVSDHESLKRALEQCSHMGNIKGCLQLSMVMREAEVKDVALQSINEALSPKVEGTMNLDELLPTDMDFFIIFSSITGIVGLPGVLPYAMGNVFQDEFARSRVSRGQKAISVDLGVAADVGYVAENYRQSGLHKVGFLGVTEVDIHALLSHYCNPALPIASLDRAQIVVGLETLAAANARGTAGGPWYQRRLFNNINALRASRKTGKSSRDGVDTAVNLASTLRGLQDRREAVALVLDALMGKLTALFGIDRNGAETDQPLHSLGLDSLVAIEIRNWFLRFVRADIAVFEILGNISVADLADLAVARSECFKLADDN